MSRVKSKDAKRYNLLNFIKYKMFVESKYAHQVYGDGMRKLYVSLLVIVSSISAIAHESNKKLSSKSIGHDLSYEGGELYGKFSLTFDDGPHPRFTEQILDTLELFNEELARFKKKKIRATFFINGNQVADYRYRIPNEKKYASHLVNLIHPKLDIVSRIVNDGHILANHSVSHSNLNKTFLDRTPKIVQDEIYLTHEAVSAYMPDISECKNKRFFRAPYGAWRARNAPDANQETQIVRKYVGPVYWDIGSRVRYYPGTSIPRDAADWECRKDGRSAEFCARGYLNNSYRTDDNGPLQGGIVLLHDIQSITPKMLPYLLRVWTGLNPYSPGSNTYERLEKFVTSYKFESSSSLEHIALDEIRSLNKYDERFSNGDCE